MRKVAFAVGAGESLHLQDYDAQFIATDNDGIAAVTYNAFPIDQNQGDEIDTVTATWNTLSAAFTVIITQVPSWSVGERAALRHSEFPIRHLEPRRR